MHGAFLWKKKEKRSECIYIYIRLKKICIYIRLKIILIIFDNIKCVSFGVSPFLKRQNNNYTTLEQFSEDEKCPSIYVVVPTGAIYTTTMAGTTPALAQAAHSVSMWWFTMGPFTLWPWPVPHPVWLRMHPRHFINTCSVTSLTSLLQTHYLYAMMFTNLALLEFSKSQSNIGWRTGQLLPCSALLLSRAEPHFHKLSINMGTQGQPGNVPLMQIVPNGSVTVQSPGIHSSSWHRFQTHRTDTAGLGRAQTTGSS